MKRILIALLLSALPFSAVADDRKYTDAQYVAAFYLAETVCGVTFPDFIINPLIERGTATGVPLSTFADMMLAHAEIMKSVMDDDIDKKVLFCVRMINSYNKLQE